MADENISEQVKTEVDKVKAGESEAKTETTSSVVSEKDVIVKLEEKAREGGWRPLDEWDGEPTEWRDARSFLDRGELLNKISTTNRENKELRKAFKALQEHNLKAAQSGYEKALTDLKAKRVEAMRENEPEKAILLEEQIDAVKDSIAEVKASAAREAAVAEEAETINPVFSNWVEKNSWYGQDNELREFADDTGRAYAKSHPGIKPEDVLKYVSERVRKAYPEKFTNPNRDKPSGVDGGSTRRSSGASSKDSYDMSPEEEKVFKTLHAQDPKFWTREKYVADLKGVTLR